MKASVSLWSADLANLKSEIQRIDDFADMYHLDVSDGTYAASLLLFFPDLVRALRDKTSKHFEVHLITQRPERWVNAFAEAGANRIIFYPDCSDDWDGMIGLIRSHGLEVGMSLALENPVSSIEAYVSQLDLVCVVGTSFDLKGVQDVAPGTYEKVTELVQLRQDRKLQYLIEADGAIRNHTVPKFSAAGADIVVPGSLMFAGEPKAISEWLRAI